MKYTIALFAFLMSGIGAFAADTRDWYLDSKAVMGTWSIPREGSRSDRIGGVMSIQPDGHIAIAVSARLLKGETAASISEQQAASWFRETLVLAGRYVVEEPKGTVSLLVHVEDASDPSYIGKDFRLIFKVHGEKSIVTGVDDEKSWLNDSWQRVGSK